MAEEAERSRAARRAAERALIRVVHHYGGRPEFVVLGGLVPELLCAGSGFRHAGTTDVDVQVDLEIALGAAQTRRLELALLNAEFEPDGERVWRWKADGHERGAVVKFELLADLPDQAAGAEIVFAGCESLGAANLRGTGFAARDVEVRQLTAKVQSRSPGSPGSSSPSAPRRTRAASARTGTTSPSCCSTTTTAAPTPPPRACCTCSATTSGLSARRLTT